MTLIKNTPGVITVALQGGLGNQLFQLCEAIVLSRRSERGFKLCLFRLRASRLPSFQTYRLELSELVGKDEVHSMRASCLLRFKSVYQQSIKERGPLDDISARVTSSTMLVTGYFQRYAIAQEASSELLRRMETSTQLSNIFNGDLQHHIAVHIRCGDYLKSSSRSLHGLTEPSYYSQAVRAVSSKTGIHKLCIVSDDPTSALKIILRERLQDDFDIKVSQKENAWDDLVMLANSAAVVMSNSSFSWWGAYLASRLRNSPVIAPYPWYVSPTGVEQLLFDPKWQVINRGIIKD